MRRVAVVVNGNAVESVEGVSVLRHANKRLQSAALHSQVGIILQNANTTSVMQSVATSPPLNGHVRSAFQHTAGDHTRFVVLLNALILVLGVLNLRFICNQQSNKQVL